MERIVKRMERILKRRERTDVTRGNMVPGNLIRKKAVTCSQNKVEGFHQRTGCEAKQKKEEKIRCEKFEKH